MTSSNRTNAVANTFSRSFDEMVDELITELAFIGIDKETIKTIASKSRTYKDVIVKDVLNTGVALPVPVQPASLTSAASLRPLPQIQSPKKVEQELNIASSIIREVNKESEEDDQESKSNLSTPRESIDKKWFETGDF